MHFSYLTFWDIRITLGLIIEGLLYFRDVAILLEVEALTN